MEFSQVTVNGKGLEAWVPWKGDVEVLLAYIPPTELRKLRAKIQRPQFLDHQRMENAVDETALRDFYCGSVVRSIRGLTKDGQPFDPSPAEVKAIWDGNHDFGPFVIRKSMELEAFVQEKKD